MAAATKTLTRTLLGAGGSLFLFACAVPSCGKRKLVDISAYGYALEGAAHGGFFGINLGVSDLIVVRGSDGAAQRVHLEGGWGAPSVAYVDATQIWFGHGASPASGTSFARIALDPWP